MVAVCPKCENDRAYFKQIQIRSADEPMTRCKLISHYVIYITRLTQSPLVVYRYVLTRATWVIRSYLEASCTNSACGNVWKED